MLLELAVCCDDCGEWLVSEEAVYVGVELDDEVEEARDVYLCPDCAIEHGLLDDRGVRGRADAGTESLFGNRGD